MYAIQKDCSKAHLCFGKHVFFFYPVALKFNQHTGTAFKKKKIFLLVIKIHIHSNDVQSHKITQRTTSHDLGEVIQHFL